MKTKKFDTVTESRLWKAAVSQKTQAMSREQVLVFFDKDKALSALAQMRQAGTETTPSPHMTSAITDIFDRRAAKMQTDSFELPATISGLWALHPLIPIADARSYEAASDVCARLAVRRLNAVQKEYFRELTALVEDYEDRHEWRLVKPLFGKLSGVGFHYIQHVAR